jgi:hypothetical protein
MCSPVYIIIPLYTVFRRHCEGAENNSSKIQKQCLFYGFSIPAKHIFKNVSVYWGGGDVRTPTISTSPPHPPRTPSESSLIYSIKKVELIT